MDDRPITKQAPNFKLSSWLLRVPALWHSHEKESGVNIINYLCHNLRHIGLSREEHSTCNQITSL